MQLAHLLMVISTSSRRAVTCSIVGSPRFVAAGDQSHLASRSTPRQPTNLRASLSYSRPRIPPWTSPDDHSGRPHSPLRTLPCRATFYVVSPAGGVLSLVDGGAATEKCVIDSTSSAVPNRLLTLPGSFPPWSPSPLALSRRQNRAPAVRLSLSRVGVTGGVEGGPASARRRRQLFHAHLDCFVDLGPHQKGRVSRFEEVVNGDRADRRQRLGVPRGDLATAVANSSRLSRARRASHDRRATRRTSPRRSAGSRRRRCTLYGSAVAGERGAPARRRRPPGDHRVPVRAGLVTASARERLSPARFSEDDIERILEAVPVATPQPARPGDALPRLCRGGKGSCGRPADIVEGPMSNGSTAMTGDRGRRRRRPRRPRFVEDCVREARAASSSASADLPASTFVMARQENLETIPPAQRRRQAFGLLGELRAELVTGEHLIASRRCAVARRVEASSGVDAVRATERDHYGPASRNATTGKRRGCRRRAGRRPPSFSDGVSAFHSAEQRVIAAGRRAARPSCAPVPAALDGEEPPRTRRAARAHSCCAASVRPNADAPASFGTGSRLSNDDVRRPRSRRARRRRRGR